MCGLTATEAHRAHNAPNKFGNFPKLWRLNLSKKDRLEAGIERDYARMEMEQQKRKRKPAQEHHEGGDQCVHCGSSFTPWASVAGEYGICQDCVDNRG